MPANKQWEILRQKESVSAWCLLLLIFYLSSHAYYLPTILLGTLSLLFLIIFIKSHIIQKETNVLVLKSILRSSWLCQTSHSPHMSSSFLQMMCSHHHVRAPTCCASTMPSISHLIFTITLRLKIIIPIVQMRNLRLRRNKELPKVT